MSVSYDFSGKVALITGSSSGIGSAIAILLSKSGARVVVTGRNAQRVQSVAKQCSDVSPNRYQALEVIADVTKEEDLNRLVRETIGMFGKLDILVNNAGQAIIAGSCCGRDYMEKYRQTLDTNLNSIVCLTHKCIEYLVKTKGNVINISSIASIQAQKNFSPYSVSKSGLDMFTKCLAVDLGSKGIRVNSVNCGYVETNILQTAGCSEAQAEQVSDIGKMKYPIGRVGQSIDIANAVLFLLSDQASFITGGSLLVDGGHVAASVTLDL